MVLAQALAERGLLDAMVAGMTTAYYQVDSYVGQGNLKFLLAAAGVVCAFLLFRRRR